MVLYRLKDFSYSIINMKMCRMCFYSLGQGVSQSLVLPSREGKPTGPTAAARAGRTEEWSTTALLHTGRHASLGTLSVSPGEHKYRGRTSVLRSLHQSVNYTFKCFFLFPLCILHTILLRFAYVHVCNIMTSAFELSCNAINNHVPVLGPVLSRTVYITCVSAFCSTVFFVVLSICRAAFTITSKWCNVE